jgi:hypothetical protein
MMSLHRGTMFLCKVMVISERGLGRSGSVLQPISGTMLMRWKSIGGSIMWSELLRKVSVSLECCMQVFWCVFLWCGGCKPYLIRRWTLVVRLRKAVRTSVRRLLLARASVQVTDPDLALTLCKVLRIRWLWPSLLTKIWTSNSR